MEQQTGSKLGKDDFKVVYCHPAYLMYNKSTSCEIPGWMNDKLNQDCQEKQQCLRQAYDTTLVEESEEELKSLLMKVREESEKARLKLNIKKKKKQTMINGIWSQHFMANGWGNSGNSG